MNIALYGFMAVGKTTIGQILAESLGYSFVDMDDEIVRETGKEISVIFRDSGEDAFRRIEKKVVKKLSTGDRQVIACGGGAVLDDENVRNLRRNSTLVLLTADPHEIFNRVEKDDTRPLLNVSDRNHRINTLLASRLPTYEKIADITIDTTTKTPQQVVEEVVSRLNEV